MQITIESNIPMPNYTTRPPKYPMRSLEVGQSFFVPADGPVKTRNTLSCCMHSAAKRMGRKFTLRTVTENGVKGVRVWRIK